MLAVHSFEAIYPVCGINLAAKQRAAKGCSSSESNRAKLADGPLINAGVTTTDGRPHAALVLCTGAVALLLAGLLLCTEADNNGDPSLISIPSFTFKE